MRAPDALFDFYFFSHIHVIPRIVYRFTALIIISERKWSRT